MLRSKIIAFGVIIVGLFVAQSVITKTVLADASAYAAQLEKRPYLERSLAVEYGIRPDSGVTRNGPLAHMSRASRANKINNALEAEASRIQLEFEEKAGLLGAMFVRIDPAYIARCRFEDQHLLPKKTE